MRSLDYRLSIRLTTVRPALRFGRPIVAIVAFRLPFVSPEIGVHGQRDRACSVDLL